MFDAPMGIQCVGRATIILLHQTCTSLESCDGICVILNVAPAPNSMYRYTKDIFRSDDAVKSLKSWLPHGFIC